jgi:hypothetical protein
MRYRSLSQSGPALEFALLIGLAITLPMFEGVKNILWGLYAIAWYANRLRHGWSWQSLGGRWDGWDTILALLLVGTAVGSMFSGMHADEWRGWRDVFRMTSILWFIKRSGYGERDWLRLHIALQIGVTIATIWALIALAWPHSYEGIQLNSVGHVNQSIIYIVICFGALLAALSAYWATMPPWLRGAAIAEGRASVGRALRRREPFSGGDRDDRRARIRPPVAPPLATTHPVRGRRHHGLRCRRRALRHRHET